jgi:hypothetical protein
VVETGDRTSILAGLLGLDEWDRLQQALKSAKAPQIIKQIDATLEALGHDLSLQLRGPDSDLFESERRLAALGLERAALSSMLQVEIARAMLERARLLAQKLAVVTTLPECEHEVDLPSARRWSEQWPLDLRRLARVAERQQELIKRRAALDVELTAIEPAETRHQEARERRKSLEAERGDRATIERQLAEAREQQQALRGQQKREDRLLALLEDAGQVLAEHDADLCPVCETRTKGLAARVADGLVQRREGVADRLAEEARQAEARAGALEVAQRELRRLTEDESDTRKRVESGRSRLETLLAPGLAGSAGDRATTARAELAALDRKITELTQANRELEQLLDEHRKDQERLRELEHWLQISRRAEAKVEISTAASFGALQSALDEAAGFAVDAEQLGAMLREAQEARSEQRSAEVNHYLGRCLQEITGSEATATIRVSIKLTAKGLSYDLEDRSGGRALSILNQASIHALSLALLFAQATVRARAGLPAFVVLDDPGQSLDAAHQAGLGRALARVANHIPVLLATTPGPLADELLQRTEIARRVYRLTATGNGVGLAEQDEA